MQQSFSSVCLPACLPGELSVSLSLLVFTFCQTSYFYRINLTAALPFIYLIVFVRTFELFLSVRKKTSLFCRQSVHSSCQTPPTSHPLSNSAHFSSLQVTSGHPEASQHRPHSDSSLTSSGSNPSDSSSQQTEKVKRLNCSLFMKFL